MKQYDKIKSTTINTRNKFMPSANHETKYQREQRKIGERLGDTFLPVSTLSILGGALFLSKDKMLNELSSMDLHSFNTIGSEIIGPAAMAFFGYGILKEASVYFNKIGSSANGSAQREYNNNMREIKKQTKINPFIAHNGLRNSIPGIEHSPQLSVDNLKLDMAITRFVGIHYRTLPEIIGNMSRFKKLLKHGLTPFVNAQKWVTHLPFLKRANSNKIKNMSTLTGFAFSPESLYAKQRDKTLDDTGSPDSDWHLSPYHKYSDGDINLLHLAALVGADPTPTGREIREMPCMQDPAIQDVFKNSTDILTGLKNNTKNLRGILKAAFESLGELSQLTFKNPSDFIKSIEEWESMTHEIYDYAIAQTSNMNARQVCTETLTQLAIKIKSNNLSKKEAIRIEERLRCVASLSKRNGVHGQTSNTSPFLGAPKHAAIIADSLRAAIDTSSAWPLSGLHLPVKQDKLISLALSDDIKSAYKEMHASLYGDKHPYPSKNTIQSLCIDKLMSAVQNKVEIKLKSNSPNNSENKIKKEAENAIGDWQQRIAVKLSKELGDKLTRDNSPSPPRR